VCYNSTLRRNPRAINYLQKNRFNTVNGNDTDIIFEHNYIGHLASSSIICRQGGTVVHAVVAVNNYVDPKDDTLPLTVDYRDKAHSHGLIPKGIMKREKHGTEEEILVARIIDRAIRPLFPSGFLSEVQITVTGHAADGIIDPVVLAVNAVSSALMTSNIPWNGPVGCVRVGKVANGAFILNPTIAQQRDSSLDLLYAGTYSRPLM
jgi:polyribonucleotide nucleotidyltransferase